MSPKTFLGFFSIVSVVVIAAGISISSRYSVTTSGKAEESVFVGFSEKFEDVGIITVQDKDKTLTIKRSDMGWGIEDRSDPREGTFQGWKSTKCS